MLEVVGFVALAARVEGLLADEGGDVFVCLLVRRAFGVSSLGWWRWRRHVECVRLLSCIGLGES